jgi:hypothetical protein
MSDGFASMEALLNDYLEKYLRERDQLVADKLKIEMERKELQRRYEQQKQQKEGEISNPCSLSLASRL